MLILQDIEKSDIIKISEFDTEQIYQFTNDPFTFNSKIVLNDKDEILAAGFIRVVNEFKVTVNPKISNFMKAKVIDELIKYGISNSQCNEIIVELTNGGNHYANILEKHFKFQYGNGILMRLER